MNPIPVLLAALLSGSLLLVGAGAVAADGDYDDRGDRLDGIGAGDVGLDGILTSAGNQADYAGSAGVGGEEGDELPATLPEAVGLGLTLLGRLAEGVPPSLGDALVAAA